MNLVEYGRIILQRGWIMLLLAVLAAGGAFLLSQLMTPVYRSTVQVLIIPSRSDFGLTQAAVQLLNNRVAYLQSDVVANNIIDELSLDMEAGFLRSRTIISPNRDALTIQIDVDMEDPAVGNQLATAWGLALVRWQEELNQEAQRLDRIRAQLQDNPRESLLRPNTRINVAIGAVAGLFLGAIIIFLLEFFESNIIRRREDVERIESLRVLAVIPE